MTINSIYPVSIILPFAEYRQEVLLSDIVSLRGVGNYTEFRFANGRSLVTSITLKRYEERLSKSSSFFRISKSVIINIQFLSSYDLSIWGQVTLHNGQRFQMSRRRVLDFQKWYETVS